MFTRKTSEPLTSLVKQIDEQISKNPKLKGFVVQLTSTDGEAEVQKGLRSLATSQGIKNVPLTLMDTLAGPPSYKVAPDAEVTVVLWNQHKATASFGYGPGGLTDAEVERLVGEIAKLAK